MLALVIGSLSRRPNAKSSRQPRRQHRLLGLTMVGPAESLPVDCSAARVLLFSWRFGKFRTAFARASANAERAGGRIITVGGNLRGRGAFGSGEVLKCPSGSRDLSSRPGRPGAKWPASLFLELYSNGLIASPNHPTPPPARASGKLKGELLRDGKYRLHAQSRTAFADIAHYTIEDGVQIIEDDPATPQG